MERTRKILSQRQKEAVDNKMVFREVCRDVAENLDADLTSIWFCAKDGSAIECQCHYDALSGTFSQGQCLDKAKCQFYFETMIEYNCISAPDVYTHPATRELIEPYFKSIGVLSLLDFILHENFKPIGVICCENRREHRYWNDNDKNYLRSMASLISHRFCAC